jgi:hypothetical protein
MQWEIASGASFLRGGLSTRTFLRPNWYFGIELMTFVVKGIGLCSLTVVVLESISSSSDNRRAPGANISQW